jgi:hypothetical protein
MILRPPPYFECFASDWLAKEQFRIATMHERGLLFSMLCQVWVSASDSVPSGATALARLLGIDHSEVEFGLTERVLSFFESTNDGRLVCPELRDQKAGMLERRKERAAAGRKGGLNKKRSPTKAQLGSVAQAAPEVKRKETRREEANCAFKEEPSSLRADHSSWVAEYERH